jgi:hypothetical protein
VGITPGRVGIIPGRVGIIPGRVGIAPALKGFGFIFEEKLYFFWGLMNQNQ